MLVGAAEQRQQRLFCLQCPLASRTQTPLQCFSLDQLKHLQQIQKLQKWRSILCEWKVVWMNDWMKEQRGNRGGEGECSLRRIDSYPILSALPLSSSATEPSPPLCFCIGCFQFSGSPRHAAVSKSVGATLPPIHPLPSLLFAAVRSGAVYEWASEPQSVNEK